MLFVKYQHANGSLVTIEIESTNVCYNVKDEVG